MIFISPFAVILIACLMFRSVRRVAGWLLIVLSGFLLYACMTMDYAP